MRVLVDHEWQEVEETPTHYEFGIPGGGVPGTPSAETIYHLGIPGGGIPAPPEGQEPASVTPTATGEETAETKIMGMDQTTFVILAALGLFWYFYG